MKLLLLLFLISISVNFVSLDLLTQEFSGSTDCLKCHNISKDKINVHLVPHSHNELGFLKTVDQYYYGIKNNKPLRDVRTIITSVVHALSGNPDRRFIQVETAFFWKWWNDQPVSLRQKFKELVDNGQIEMVNGGWTMNDEACTNYQAIIDQFTWGLRRLKETVGSCGTPKVGWQIDSYGHSREQASIFVKLGYDGVFFARLHHADKSYRQSTKSLDFAWQTSANIPNHTIFGGIFPTPLYNSPNGFCWDSDCEDDSIIDDPNNEDYNLDDKIELFTRLIKIYSAYYPTNNILIPMGGDFYYAAAEANFINMDRLIKAFNGNKELNVFYSTPSCYIKAVHDSKPTLTLKTDDFFPYSDNTHDYWTGYFSTRPATKKFEKIGHNILQATKQLVALSSLGGGKNHEKNLTELREVMATFQHHDAITGTDLQDVANDYVSQLYKAIKEAEKPLGEILRNLSPDLNITLDLASCLLSNISICSTSQNADKFVVVVYNPLSWRVTHYVRLPIENPKVTIQGPDGIEKCDIVPTLDTFGYVKLPQKPSSQEMVFTAKKVPAFGYKVYFVEKSTNDTTNCKRAASVNGTTFGTKTANFVVNETTNLLNSVTINGKTVKITQNFFFYISDISGVYVFRPLKNKLYVAAEKIEKINSFSGDVVDEFHQEWVSGTTKLKQAIRVYKDEGYIEFDWIVGNLSWEIEIGYGYEVITKFIVMEDFDNTNVSFTDSNGREMIKRILNQHHDYYYNSSEEPVSGNYYPVTSKIVIQDLKKNLEVAVLNDRSQGGASLNKGEIELMVHRKVLLDTKFDEALNEFEFGTALIVRGSHYLVFGTAVEPTSDDKLKTVLSTAVKERILAHEKLLQPWVGVAPTFSTFDEIGHTIRTPFAPIDENKIPKGINIVTLEPWNERTYLVRLEHILEKEDDNELSGTKQIDLQDLFKGFTITDLVETTLGGNKLLNDFSEEEQYDWATSGTPMDVDTKEADHSKYIISLSPMQIRTFIVKFQNGSISSGNTNNSIFCLVLSLLIILFYLTVKSFIN